MYPSLSFPFCSRNGEPWWWHDLETVLKRLVSAFMSSRFPETTADKLTSILVDQFLAANLKPGLIKDLQPCGDEASDDVIRGNYRVGT